jgi:N-acetylglucosaminyldiphosphoundecaprenol N-acetyl-beta-D-mannosaminyltransferase
MRLFGEKVVLLHLNHSTLARAPVSEPLEFRANNRHLTMQPRLRRHLLGYPVDNIDIPEALSLVARFLQEEGLHHVVAINANKLWLAEHGAEVRDILQCAELVIPEYAVVWACRALNRPLKAHVGGIMLLKALLPWLERERVLVYFLGARPPVLEMMRSRMAAAHPRMLIAGMAPGYFEPRQESKIVSRINRSGAAVLFVAMGSPRQELWIERHRHDLAVKVAMGVGGSFDVLAGLKKDAPPWVRHGAEWIYRLAQDPKNLWKRYLATNPWLVYRVLRERLL